MTGSEANIARPKTGFSEEDIERLYKWKNRATLRRSLTVKYEDLRRKRELVADLAELLVDPNVDEFRREELIRRAAVELVNCINMRLSGFPGHETACFREVLENFIAQRKASGEWAWRPDTSDLDGDNIAARYPNGWHGSAKQFYIVDGGCAATPLEVLAASPNGTTEFQLTHRGHNKASLARIVDLGFASVTNEHTEIDGKRFDFRRYRITQAGREHHAKGRGHERSR
jgi:hypothetical protein